MSPPVRRTSAPRNQKPAPAAGRTATTTPTSATATAIDAEDRAQVTRHSCRRLAELDEGVDDQLDLLGVGPLARAGGPGQLLEADCGLVEAGPGDEPEDVAVGLRHRVDHVQHRARDQDDRRTLSRIGGDGRPAVEPAGEGAGQGVAHARGHRAGRSDTPYDVVTVLPGPQEAADDLQRLLKVSRERHGAVAAGRAETGGDGGVRAEVPGQRHHPCGDAGSVECSDQQCRGSVGRPVVHQDELETVVRVARVDLPDQLDEPWTFSASLNAGITRLTSGTSAVEPTPRAAVCGGGSCPQFSCVPAESVPLPAGR